MALSTPRSQAFKLELAALRSSIISLALGAMKIHHKLPYCKACGQQTLGLSASKLL
jgi:hypothetical protein